MGNSFMSLRELSSPICLNLCLLIRSLSMNQTRTLLSSSSFLFFLFSRTSLQQVNSFRKRHRGREKQRIYRIKALFNAVGVELEPKLSTQQSNVLSRWPNYSTRREVLMALLLYQVLYFSFFPMPRITQI